jgi:hypothetical protein
MALEGTIKDFGLPDIFQLIGMQRKTGVLTLKHEGESVTVTFENGQVVNADSSTKRVDDRLGALLVKQGKLAEEQLEEVLARQKQTLQRIGHILIAGQYISTEDLSRALQVQVSQLVFRLFRWKVGDYHFEQVDKIQYDREHFNPMSADFILMEGIRMLDEWPMIERKIPSMDVVFRKVVDSSQIRLGGAGLESDDGLGTRPPGASQISLSGAEATVYALVDGALTVQEIIDRAGMGDFEVCKTLFDLLSRDLIAVLGRQKVYGVSDEPREEPSRIPGFALLGAVVFAAVVGVAVQGGAPDSILGVGPLLKTPYVGVLRSVSRERIQRVDRALQAHRILRGSLPARLDALVETGLAEARDLEDPWGRPYDYSASRHGYSLGAQDVEGEALAGGQIERRWSLAGGVTP